MLGNFQHSNLRIEVSASKMWPQNFTSLSGKLNSGDIFVSSIGLIEIEHTVELIDDSSLRLLLSKGIDGFHEWHWDDGWLQSRLEGISLLPLNLGQTISLFRLRQYLSSNN